MLRWFALALACVAVVSASEQLEHRVAVLEASLKKMQGVVANCEAMFCCSLFLSVCCS